jgi:hypothetical protein
LAIELAQNWHSKSAISLQAAFADILYLQKSRLNVTVRGNFLEQLVAEWYEFNGYFVRRNVLVGRRSRGGYECELDVVAFNPEEKHLVHIEPSVDQRS